MSEEGTRKWWHFDVLHTPCARDGLLVGIGCGGLAGLGYFLKYKLITRSGDWAVGVFAATSALAFVICRSKRAARQQALRDIAESIQPSGSKESPSN